MTKLRISVVQYLNTAPLIRGFTHGPLRALADQKYDFSFTVPSQCAEALRAGAADVAIIPAIEYQRIVSQGVPLTILPDLAIASKERVRSLLLLSKVPIRQARRIALDPSSRSTQALVKILAARRWQTAPEFFEPATPASNNAGSTVGAQHRLDPARHDGGNVGAVSQLDLVAAMLADADAALIIGDAALRIAIAAEAQGATPGPDGELLAPSAVLDFRVGAQHRFAPARQNVTRAPLHIYDVVTEWRHLTNLPAVLAVWAARNDSFPNKVVPSNLTADFQASRDFGLTQIPQIAAESAREMQLPENGLRIYLQENIDYTLDQQNLQGLHRFFQESQALKLIGPLQPIQIAPAPQAAAQKRA